MKGPRTFQELSRTFFLSLFYSIVCDFSIHNTGKNIKLLFTSFTATWSKSIPITVYKSFDSENFLYSVRHIRGINNRIMQYRCCTDFFYCLRHFNTGNF